jgi:hypothetical protein
METTNKDITQDGSRPPPPNKNDNTSRKLFGLDGDDKSTRWYTMKQDAVGYCERHLPTLSTKAHGGREDVKSKLWLALQDNGFVEKYGPEIECMRQCLIKHWGAAQLRPKDVRDQVVGWVFQVNRTSVDKSRRQNPERDYAHASLEDVKDKNHGNLAQASATMTSAQAGARITTTSQYSPSGQGSNNSKRKREVDNPDEQEDQQEPKASKLSASGSPKRGISVTLAHRFSTTPSRSIMPIPPAVVSAPPQPNWALCIMHFVSGENPTRSRTAAFLSLCPHGLSPPQVTDISMEKIEDCLRSCLELRDYYPLAGKYIRIAGRQEEPELITDQYTLVVLLVKWMAQEFLTDHTNIHLELWHTWDDRVREDIVPTPPTMAADDENDIPVKSIEDIDDILAENIQDVNDSYNTSRIPQGKRRIPAKLDDITCNTVGMNLVSSQSEEWLPEAVLDQLLPKSSEAYLDDYLVTNTEGKDDGANTSVQDKPITDVNDVNNAEPMQNEMSREEETEIQDATEDIESAAGDNDEPIEMSMENNDRQSQLEAELKDSKAAGSFPDISDLMDEESQNWPADKRKAFAVVREAFKNKTVKNSATVGYDPNNVTVQTAAGAITLPRKGHVNEDSRERIRQLLKLDDESSGQTQHFNEFCNFIKKSSGIDETATQWNRETLNRVAFHLKKDSVADIVEHPMSYTILLPSTYVKTGGQPRWWQVIEAVNLLDKGRQGCVVEGTIMGFGKTFLMWVCFVLNLVWRVNEEYYYHDVVLNKRPERHSQDGGKTPCQLMEEARQQPGLEWVRCRCEYGEGDFEPPIPYHGQTLVFADPGSLQTSILPKFRKFLNWSDLGTRKPRSLTTTMYQKFTLPPIFLLLEYQQGTTVSQSQRWVRENFEALNAKLMRTLSDAPHLEPVRRACCPLALNTVMTVSAHKTWGLRRKASKRDDTVFDLRTGGLYVDEGHKSVANDDELLHYNANNDKNWHCAKDHENGNNDEPWWDSHQLIIMVSGSAVQGNPMKKLAKYLERGEIMARNAGRPWNEQTSLKQYTKAKLKTFGDDYDRMKAADNDEDREKSVLNQALSSRFIRFIEQFFVRQSYKSNMFHCQVAEELAEDIHIEVEYSKEQLETADGDFNQQMAAVVISQMKSAHKSGRTTDMINDVQNREKLEKAIQAQMKSNKFKVTKTYFPGAHELVLIWARDIEDLMTKNPSSKLTVGPPVLRDTMWKDASDEDKHSLYKFRYTQKMIQDWKLMQPAHNPESLLDGPNHKYIKALTKEAACPWAPYFWVTLA